jgi:hypothetical protein
MQLAKDKLSVARGDGDSVFMLLVKFDALPREMVVRLFVGARILRRSGMSLETGSVGWHGNSFRGLMATSANVPTRLRRIR